jgi:hypothetical protein
MRVKFCSPMSSYPVIHKKYNEHHTHSRYSSIFRAVFDPNDHGIDPLTPTQHMVFEERRRMREGRNGNDDPYSRRSLRQRRGYPVGVSFGHDWADRADQSRHYTQSKRCDPPNISHHCQPPSHGKQQAGEQISRQGPQMRSQTMGLFQLQWALLPMGAASDTVPIYFLD